VLGHARAGVPEQLEVLETDIPMELIKIVSDKLASFEDYKASKMLFFGLLTANEMIITSQWKKAINKVLTQAGKLAFADLPEGRIIRCSADTSGSMSWEEAKVTNSLYAVDIASYLTAAIALSTPNTQAYATASLTKTVPFSNDNLIDCAAAITRTDVGGGTRFETLLDGYKGEDVVIIVTDGQDSSNMESKWRSLTNKPRGAKLVVWRVVGHNNKISNDSNVLYLGGFNDSLLNTLANIITGKAGQMEMVRNYKI
jgi:hypothetical protein